MNEPAPSSVVVTLSLAPPLEERIIDWLLEQKGVTTFTGYATYAHGVHGGDLSVAEQVIGRQRRTELRVELPATALDGWLSALARTFGAADVRFCVTAVLRSGHLRERNP